MKTEMLVRNDVLILTDVLVLLTDVLALLTDVMVLLPDVLLIYYSSLIGICFLNVVISECLLSKGFLFGRFVKALGEITWHDAAVVSDPQLTFGDVG